MVDVVSLAGTPGLGENVVTSGLGPAPQEAPPTPPRKRRGGAGEQGDRRWREHWRERLAAQAALELLRAQGEQMAAETAAQALDDLEWIDDAAAEADYLIMTAGDEALIRAPAAGDMHYARSKKYGLCAVLKADTGARYLITGLGRTADRKVEAGEVIGKTPPVSKFVRAAATATSTADPPQLSAGSNVVDLDVFTIVVDPDGQVVMYNDGQPATDASQERASGAPIEVRAPTGSVSTINKTIFAWGTVAAAVVMLTGQPLLAAFIFSGVIVLAAAKAGSGRN